MNGTDFKNLVQTNEKKKKNPLIYFSSTRPFQLSASFDNQSISSVQLTVFPSAKKHTFYFLCPLHPSTRYLIPFVPRHCIIHILVYIYFRLINFRIYLASAYRKNFFSSSPARIFHAIAPSRFANSRGNFSGWVIGGFLL